LPETPKTSITRNEFKIALSVVYILIMLKRMWFEIDLKNGGVLCLCRGVTIQEMFSNIEFLIHIGYIFNKEEINQIFQELDINGDKNLS